MTIYGGGNFDLTDVLIVFLQIFQTNNSNNLMIPIQKGLKRGFRKKERIYRKGKK